MLCLRRSSEDHCQTIASNPSPTNRWFAHRRSRGAHALDEACDGDRAEEAEQSERQRDVDQHAVTRERRTDEDRARYAEREATVVPLADLNDLDAAAGRVEDALARLARA